MDGTGGEDTGDRGTGSKATGASAPDAVAKSEAASRTEEAEEVSGFTGSSVVRTVVAFLAGLGVFFALLYALSIVLNSY
ncbi:hypothetical protein C475_07766 [Halosimplex carlsbadense 2-9-1]|uniref:Uncharacterized protein n=1 Tax=Halosimplex carlsbadense 2-9-1 TaxID=797114 RepID=M0CY43_9EURY|nr:hypothetical protein [Halosimplex carlsbadense]ELZ26814.1 hypothetical protein C475_07766 [Halosimplex carlsbadense 2-9-1]